MTGMRITIMMISRIAMTITVMTITRTETITTTTRITTMGRGKVGGDPGGD